MNLCLLSFVTPFCVPCVLLRPIRPRLRVLLVHLFPIVVHGRPPAPTFDLGVCGCLAFPYCNMSKNLCLDLGAIRPCSRLDGDQRARPYHTSNPRASAPMKNNIPIPGSARVPGSAPSPNPLKKSATRRRGFRCVSRCYRTIVPTVKSMLEFFFRDVIRDKAPRMPRYYFFSTRSIPHLGHLPGSSVTTSGCMAQVY